MNSKVIDLNQIKNSVELARYKADFVKESLKQEELQVNQQAFVAAGKAMGKSMPQVS